MKTAARLLSLCLLASIRGYQLLVSPFFPPSCRYLPTCSQYAREAVTVHGPVKGTWLALRRLLRCHPWAECRYDPVPEKESAAKSTSGLGLCPDCRHLDHQSGR